MSTALKAGEGCYAAYLTPQGRMIADLYVYELGDVILLTVPREQTAGGARKARSIHLQRRRAARRRERLRSRRRPLSVRMRRGLSRGLTGIAAADLAAWPEHGNRRGEFDGHAGHRDASDRRRRSRATTCTSRRRRAATLRRRLEEAGVPALNAETAEALRIEAGVPRFNRDMDQETIPLEAGIESRAISFSKGCYVGQEVIIRVLHRGHGRVARKLVGLLCDTDAVPAAGATVTVGGRDIGHVTSSALSAALNQPIALAYLHRDFLTPGTAVSIDGQTAVGPPTAVCASTAA